MTKRILWESKHMTFSLEENINIYFFNNENASYKKSYTLYYAPVIVSEGSRSSAGDD